MLTINIEDTTIHILQFAGKHIRKADAIPLAPGMVENGAIIDKNGVSSLLKEAFLKNRITDKDAVTGINGIHTTYRAVSLPHIDKKLADDAAHHELERAMPVSLDELYTSWQMIDISDTETLLCMIGTPRNTVDSILETLRLADLQSRGLDITPLAAARIADQKDAIVLNIQHLSFDIVIINDGIPMLLRSVAFPSSSISSTEKTVMLKEELDRTVAFYNSAYSESAINPDISVFVSGETMDSLEHTLGYTLKPVPSWMDHPDDISTDGLSVNIGLALRQLNDISTPLRITIDSTPAVYLPRSRPFAEVLPWLILLTGICILIPMFIMMQQSLSATAELQKQLLQSETEVKKLQIINNWSKQTQSRIDAYKEYETFMKDTVNTVKAMRERTNLDLAQITSNLPGTIDLSLINYGKDYTASISGFSPDKNTALDYTKALRDSKRFTTVILADLREVEYGKWSFTLQLQ